MNIAICRSSKKSLNEFFLKAVIEKPNETTMLESGMITPDNSYYSSHEKIL